MLKSIRFAVLVVVMSVTAAFAQDNYIHNNVENPPEYPGGLYSQVSFIKANLRHPVSAVKLFGRVFIRVVIRSNGWITDPIVLKGLSPEYNQEALRVVKMFPQYKPGRLRGRPVACYLIIPIMFGPTTLF
jgi:hypothetical protein